MCLLKHKTCFRLQFVYVWNKTKRADFLSALFRSFVKLNWFFERIETSQFRFLRF